MIVYHCSLSSIEKFVYAENGVHFGGRNSAIEAALRKTLSGKETLFLHKCNINSERFFDCDDQGNHSEWIKIIEQSITDGYKTIRYINKYEPDSKPSYIVLDSKEIEIMSVSRIKASDAEREILDFYY